QRPRSPHGRLCLGPCEPGLEQLPAAMAAQDLAAVALLGPPANGPPLLHERCHGGEEVRAPIRIPQADDTHHLTASRRSQAWMPKPMDRGVDSIDTPLPQ